MAKTGTADKDLVLLEEEMEALYAQRPASLRVTESGKKERDPQYHCVMEKVRLVSTDIAHTRAAASHVCSSLIIVTESLLNETSSSQRMYACS